MSTSRERVLSGVQATGTPHLGNLLGAFRRWAADQDVDESIFFIADLHSLTVPFVPSELHAATLDMAAILLAVGLDPERTTLFLQSQVREHAELAWILNCIATFGEVRRMTQFKEKSGGQESVSLGLFTYPVLQAADILMYQPHRVPVGDDQRQHLELTRDIAIRFNGRFGDVFRVPEASVPKVGARVMDLQEPTKKMSKSGGTELGTIWLTDPPARLKKKIMGAVTDSGSEVRADPVAKPGVTALLDILAAVTDTTVADLEVRYEGSQYGGFKKDVLDAVVAYLEPIQARYAELSADPAEVERILAVGADRARHVAVETMAAVRSALGLVGA
ncbi:MAG TPA: tryptophan--tRNA ligase [Miltoncostaeales bacterium]|jgi:tryptophanyl-tRNA synthetase|nr:tryptophan--tRNA ligase [Miltoncostaeales bacterium]